MIWSSLRLRLTVTAALSILLALALAGFFLTLIFERHVTRRIDNELSAYIKQLAASLDPDAEGEPILLAPLADPKFDLPLSGLYWQIEDEASVVLASRSLWAGTLAVPPVSMKTSGPIRFETVGPNGETVIVRARTIFLETASGDKAFRIATAIDKQEIVTARDAFTRELFVALALLACALLAASWLQIFFGLRPLRQIRERVNAVRTGSASRLEGRFPNEVELLVSEVNALLGANEIAVERARDSAADLAHGLKTPLAILQAESRTLAERQQTDAADEIASQVEQMRSRVEHHLALVRMRGPGGARQSTNAHASVMKVVRAMQTMPRGEEIKWSVDIPVELNLEFDDQDFLEILGNILDNARKWAAHEVRIAATDLSNTVELTVTDDGPGVPEEKLDLILRRGKRLDEMKTGAGLGLSIAEKICENYGAKLSFRNFPDGGARIAIIIPKTVSL